MVMFAIDPLEEGKRRQKSFKKKRRPTAGTPLLRRTFKALKAIQKKKLRELRSPAAEKELRWWETASVEYAFTMPHVRARLEKLMGSNIVKILSKEYMETLQSRILEDYSEMMEKRIKVREGEEMNRVKNLVLSGKIPWDQAPPSMCSHPLMLLENYCRELIEKRRALYKIPKISVPTNLYWDDTPDPPSGLTIEKGHSMSIPGAELCLNTEYYLSIDQDGEVKRGYMFRQDVFDRLIYQDPLVAQLKACESVEEMYALAERIVAFADEEEKPTKDVVKD